MRARLFTSNWNALLAIALGVILTSAPKLVSGQAGWFFQGWIHLARFPE